MVIAADIDIMKLYIHFEINALHTLCLVLISDKNSLKLIGFFYDSDI